jgi:hypothetical protein
MSISLFPSFAAKTFPNAEAYLNYRRLLCKGESSGILQEDFVLTLSGYSDILGEGETEELMAKFLF